MLPGFLLCNGKYQKAAYLTYVCGQLNSPLWSCFWSVANIWDTAGHILCCVRENSLSLSDCITSHICSKFWATEPAFLDYIISVVLYNCDNAFWTRPSLSLEVASISQGSTFPTGSFSFLHPWVQEWIDLVNEAQRQILSSRKEGKWS